MNVTITVHIMSDNARVSVITAAVADVVEKALTEVPYATEVTSVTTERETI